MPRWKSVRLGDYVDSSLGKMLDANKNKGDLEPYLGNSNVRWGQFDLANLAQMRFESHEAERYGIRAGDLIVCEGGEPGRCAIWREELPRMKIQKALHRVRVKSGLDSLYLYYWFMLASRKGRLEPHFTGTTIMHLTGKALAELEVPLPPLEEQRAISAVLGALDDKIELNRRMNETLEAMAGAIFRDWFVDFGPTNTKMAMRGEDPQKENIAGAPYLAPDLWSLFPDRVDDEGKPEGWVTSTIGQEVEVVGGSTPSTKEPTFWGGDIAWATPKDLSSLSTPVLLSTERQITEAGLSQIGSGLLPAGTVLLSSRAPIGYLAIAQVPVAVNQGFIAMICNKRLSNVFVWLWTQANMESVHQNANGSTFQEISKANFRPIELTVATPELRRAFDEIAQPLFHRIVANDKEQRTLAATRDVLLPKLMSGEIRVKHAEKIVGDAT